MAKVIVYQLYPIAWDGGIEEMIDHLPRIKELGVTHVWLSPLYPSPRADHGYDISDYYKIDRKIGTMRKFDEFVKQAHKLGLKVLMDLVLNHTSTKHSWFKEKPEYYCWAEEPLKNWDSLFGGSAWEWDDSQGMFYCHLFDKKQADLDWFPDGNINYDLVQEFRNIVKFWTTDHKVDGFRLDVPQGINKDFGNDNLELNELLFGDLAVAVINAVFSGLERKPFLMMECLDPTFGQIIQKYVGGTSIDYCLNVLLKEERDKGWQEFHKAFYNSCKTSGFMLDLESHDSPRFTSRSGCYQVR